MARRHMIIPAALLAGSAVFAAHALLQHVPTDTATTDTATTTPAAATTTLQAPKMSRARLDALSAQLDAQERRIAQTERDQPPAAPRLQQVSTGSAQAVSTIPAGTGSAPQPAAAPAGRGGEAEAEHEGGEHEIEHEHEEHEHDGEGDDD